MLQESAGIERMIVSRFYAIKEVNEMNNNINIQEVIRACDKVGRRCTRIANTYHGSSWLFDKLMRYFEAEKSAESITFDVTVNACPPFKGEATISRLGDLVMRRK